MKKIILTAAAIFAFGFANAQESTEGGFSKGDAFITGSVGFGSSKYTANGNFKENTFTLAPKAGYFVTENIALGLGLNYSSIKVEEFDGADEDKVNMFGIEAFGRYYWTPASQFSFFAQGSVGYATIDYDAYKVNGFGIEVAPGVSYFITKNLAIEAAWGVLSYSSLKPDYTGAESSTNFNLGLDLSDLNFGLVYKF